MALVEVSLRWELTGLSPHMFPYVPGVGGCRTLEPLECVFFLDAVSKGCYGADSINMMAVAQPQEHERPNVALLQKDAIRALKSKGDVKENVPG